MDFARITKGYLDYFGIPPDPGVHNQDWNSYESILSAWCDTGFNPYSATWPDWRLRFIKLLRLDNSWKAKMRAGLRGRPSDDRDELVGNVISNARGDPLRLLYNLGVSVKKLLREVESARCLYVWCRIEAKITRSLTYRNEMISALESARKHFHQAEFFTFGCLSRPSIQEELRHRGVIPQQSGEWYEAVLWNLKQLKDAKAGRPSKRGHVDRLEYVLLRIAQDDIDHVVLLSDYDGLEWRDLACTDTSPRWAAGDKLMVIRGTLKAPVLAITKAALSD